MFGSCRAAVCMLAAFAIYGAPVSAPAKFVVFDIVAQDAHGEPVRDLQPGDIRITDDEQAQQVVYCRADRGRPETPRPTVVVLDLSYAPVKSAAWNEVVRSLRQFETSAPLYFGSSEEIVGGIGFGQLAK